MHVTTNQGFSKKERLCHIKEIQELFSRGSSFYLAPFRIKHAISGGENTVHQVLITVPKRLFRKAVDRNRIKRRIRESYRRRKAELQALPPLHIVFILSSGQHVDQLTIDKAMEKILRKLCNEYAAHDS